MLLHSFDDIQQGLFELCVIRGYYVSHICSCRIFLTFVRSQYAWKSKSPGVPKEEWGQSMQFNRHKNMRSKYCRVQSGLLRLLPFVSAEYHNIPHSAPANRRQSQNIQSMQYVSQIFSRASQMTSLNQLNIARWCNLSSLTVSVSVYGSNHIFFVWNLAIVVIVIVAGRCFRRDGEDDDDDVIVAKVFDIFLLTPANFHRVHAHTHTACHAPENVCGQQFCVCSMCSPYA